MDTTSRLSEDGYPTSDEKCHPPRAKLFLVTLISFIVATLIVLLVVLTRVDPNYDLVEADNDMLGCWFENPCVENDTDSDQCYDVIIVGAGLAGSYAAWRLRDSNLSVALYETSDRVGGQLYTYPMRNFYTPDSDDSVHLELGGSYYIPELHPLLAATIASLGLETRPFPDNMTAEDVWYHLRGVRVAPPGDCAAGCPYTLDDHEAAMEIYKLYRAFSANGVSAWRNILCVIKKDNIALQRYLLECEDPQWRSDMVNGSEPDVRDCSLLDESLTNVLLDSGSYEAYQFLRDSFDFPEFIQSAHARVFLEYLRDRSDLSDVMSGLAQQRTLVGGMDILPRTLVSEASKNNTSFSLFLNHKLVKIHGQSDLDTYTLSFNDTFTNVTGTYDLYMTSNSCARSIVMATSPESVLGVVFEPTNLSEAVLQDFQHLEPMGATRAVFIYDDVIISIAALPKRVQSDLPIGGFDIKTLCENTYGAGNSTESSSSNSYEIGDKCFTVITISAYGDNHLYLDSLLTGSVYRDTSEFPAFEDLGNRVATERFVHQVQKYLNAIFKADDMTLDLPAKVVVQQWDASAPGGQGLHYWSPGSDWTNVIDDVMMPFEDVSLFLIGSAYAPSYRQLWAEGALYTTEQYLSLWLSTS